MRLREIPLQRPEERDRLESQITALQATIANHALTDAQKDSRIQELNAACSQKDSWIAHLEAALHRSTSRPDAEDLAIPDWGLGLPLEMLATVAGGRQELAAMRGVSKLWQKGFEASVRKLTIGAEGPLLLPPNGSFCERFAGLTSLDVGNSLLAEADLAQLAGLKQLQVLLLGDPDRGFFKRNGVPLSSRVTGSCFQFLLGLPITELYLNRAGSITQEALEILQGLPLTLLDLSGVCDKIVDLGALRGMQIHTLVLSCEYLSDDSLEALVGMPLTSLELAQTSELENFLGPILDDDDDDFVGGAFPAFRATTFTGVGLEYLRGLPLTNLNLSSQRKLLDASLENLRGMPLRALDISKCYRLTDEGIGFLSGFRISDLDVSGCELLTDDALGHLVGMPLSKLNLSGCKLVEDRGIEFLRGMKLTSLGLGECKITSLGLSYLEGMPIESLDVYSCKLLSGDGLKFLYGMPLTKLLVGRCAGLIDADLRHLAGLPLTFLNISGYSTITDAGMGFLEALPLKQILMDGCCQVSYKVDAQFKQRGVENYRFG